MKRKYYVKLEASEFEIFRRNDWADGGRNGWGHEDGYGNGDGYGWSVGRGFGSGYGDALGNGNGYGEGYFIIDEGDEE